MSEYLDRTIVSVTEVAAERNNRKQKEGRDHGKERSKDENSSLSSIRDEVFFEEEFDSVSKRLKNAEWTGRVGADTILEVAYNFAFEPNHEHRRHEQEGEDRQDLQHDDQNNGEVDVTGEKWITSEHQQHLPKLRNKSLSKARS